MKLVAAGRKVLHALHNRVFAELGKRPDRKPLLANKILLLLELLNKQHPTRRHTTIHSISHAGKLWAKYRVGEYYPQDHRALRDLLGVKFPHPPFESRWLHPISNSQAMIRLALSMRNCIFLHWNDVICGNMYFFYVAPNLLFPELAIIQVVRSKYDRTRWIVSAIEGSRNQKLSEEHQKFIEYEIEKAQDRIDENHSSSLTFYPNELSFQSNEYHPICA